MTDTKKIFRVTSIQETDGKKYYNEIGRVVLHANGNSGVLFLHMFPGNDYALFLGKPHEGKNQGPDTEAPSDQQG